MAALEITYEDNIYILDLEDMDTDEARAMERFGVKNLKALEDGIGEGDINALTVAFWLMLKQSGEVVRIDRVKFKPVKFIRCLGEAGEKASTEAEDPKDV